MVRKGYTPEQIINKLREAEVMLIFGQCPCQSVNQYSLVSHKAVPSLLKTI